MEHATADVIAMALDELARGSGRTRPVSVSLPGPLLDALQSLAQDGRISSTSAAVTEALTTWLHNKLLRLTLDEIYDEHPDLRPTPERVTAMARRVGVSVPRRVGKTVGG